jgi:hypothetical protein
VLIPAVLVAAVVLQATVASPTRASRGQAATQSLTIRASSPLIPKTFSTGLLSVTLVNDTKGPVNVGLGRANPGQTAATVRAADAASNAGTLAGFNQLLQAITFLGGINTLLPGAAETATIRLATPGLYGASVSPANGPDHLYLFTVTAGAGAPAALPMGNVTVTLKNFKFVGLPKTLVAGPTTFQLINTGTMVHEMIVARLDPGKIQQDALKLLESPQGQNGSPPAWVHFVGGMEIISPHQSANVTVTLTSGYYLVLCTMPDMKKKGEPHFMEGMIGHFTVS